MKKTREPHRARPLAAMAACFAAGLAAGWWLHATGGPKPVVTGVPAVVDGPTAGGPAEAGHDRDRDDEAPSSVDSAGPSSAASGFGRTDQPVATSGQPAVAAAPAGSELGGPIEQLQRRHLRVPIDNLDVETMKGGFAEHRAGSGGHAHEAVDILAPRNTPVRAVESGAIAKLFISKAGGNTIYQFDPSERFAYYYAHLERYADGVREGRVVKAGDVIGYVGTSGNAPSGTPHLHFAVFDLGAGKRWWKGDALDPYLVFRD